MSDHNALPDVCPRCGSNARHVRRKNGVRYECGALLTRLGELIDLEGACQIARLTAERDRLRKRLEKISDDEAWAHSQWKHGSGVCIAFQGTNVVAKKAYGVNWVVQYAETAGEALRALRAKCEGGGGDE